MADLTSRNYIKWNTEGVEKKQENEDEDIQKVAEMINQIQIAQYNVHRHAYSGTHARTQGVIKGTFEALENLPEHLKQGEIFSKGGSYPVIARYSSESGDPGLDDRIPVPRGFAMKLFNVHGDFLEDGKDFPTQDIEFNSTPSIDLATAKTAREIIDLRIKYGNNQPELYKHLEARDDTELQKFRDTLESTHVEATRQYSQTAYRFGDYVMKYCLVYNGEAQKKLFTERERLARPRCSIQMGKRLSRRTRGRVPLSGKVWDAQKYPWQTVATVKFPKQNSFDYKRKAFWEDRIRVDPWHGLKAYQALGSPNRLRKVVYPASSRLRREMNGTTEVNVKIDR